MTTAIKSPTKLLVSEWSEEIFNIHLQSPLTRICIPKGVSSTSDIKEPLTELNKHIFEKFIKPVLQ